MTTQGAQLGRNPKGHFPLPILQALGERRCMHGPSWGQTATNSLATLSWDGAFWNLPFQSADTPILLFPPSHVQRWSHPSFVILQAQSHPTPHQQGIQQPFLGLNKGKKNEVCRGAQEIPQRERIQDLEALGER